MPAFAPITIADGNTTPVDHTYAPNGRPNGVAEFSEKDGIPVGDNSLTVSSKHGAREKISLRLRLPQVVEETINGVMSPRVVRTAYVRVDFDFSEMSTLEERTDARALAASLLGSDQTALRAVIESLEDIY
jgi:hypothetical protein